MCVLKRFLCKIQCFTALFFFFIEKSTVADFLFPPSPLNGIFHYILSNNNFYQPILYCTTIFTFSPYFFPLTQLFLIEKMLRTKKSI